jgi:hypothetical protein
VNQSGSNNKDIDKFEMDSGEEDDDLIEIKHSKKKISEKRK